MRKYSFILFICIVFVCSIQISFGQNDVENDWVKHVIASNINQDHGHSLNKADFNGDGRIDLSIAWGQRDGGKSTDGIWWYECPENPKTESWIKQRITDPNNLVLWSMSHAVGDIDNDGDLDVIALGFDRGDVQLAVNPLNNGGDVNQPWATYKIWANASRKRDGERCEIIDMDGDGYKDFVFPRGQDPMSAFILFNPKGNPTGKWVQKELGGIAGSDAHDIYVADIDNDGDLDVVSASGDGMTRGAIYWFEQPNGNPRNGSWNRHRVDSESWNYGALNVEDIDRDGFVDILCNHAHHTPGANGYPDTYNILWFKNPKNSGRWTEYGIGKQTYPHAASLIDVDGDGINELWVADASMDPKDSIYGQYSGGVVYFKRGADPTQPWKKYRVAKAPAVGRQGAVYDIDKDGDLDIATSSDHDGNHHISLVWWENRTERFTPTSPAKPDVLLPSQQAVPPKEGEEVGWWKLPGVIVAGDDDVCGFAWDGSQLWVANYSYRKYKSKAFRLDINSAAYGSTPDITRVIDYAGNSVEGIDHDRNGHLYIGMRYKESRSSASIVKYDDLTGTELKRYSSFSYPKNFTICHSYTDPDGTVLDHKGNLYWCVKGDHYKECNPTVANTAVQMMTLSGKVVKRFWLPWYYATPAFYNGYFIYKKGGRFTNPQLVYPYPEDSIEIVKIDGIQNNTIASISKTVKISGPHYHSDKRYLGATYFDDHLYLINQDTDPIHIIKIYLPLESAHSPVFKKHVIQRPMPTTKNNTVPNMVWVLDVDGDGQKDIIASHVGWGSFYGGASDGAEHPYVAWYKGPSFKQEFIMIDKNTPGLNGNSRIYRFVMYDVDKDGKKDLIGQGYQPFHNENKWYKCPDDPTKRWDEWYDYGNELVNGHDIRLWDVDGDGKKDVILQDCHSGKTIVKKIPSGDSIYSKWPYTTITEGDGYTHYMSFFDVNKDGFEDIVCAKEEDGGEGIKWYEHPGYDKALTQKWEKHFVVDANFTKAFARDLDEDGDIDYIGTGEMEGVNIGWFKKTANGYVLDEFDKKDNNNDVNGGHNCALVDVDGDGDEDLIVGGVDKKDGKQRFRWYEKKWVGTEVKFIEHIFGITSAPGFTAHHGFYCGEMTWDDIDNDGDMDFIYSGQGSGFLGWFENTSITPHKQK